MNSIEILTINIIQSILILFGLILIFILPVIHILKGEKPLKFIFIIWFYLIIWTLFFDGICPQLVGAVMAGWVHGVVIVGFSILLKKIINFKKAPEDTPKNTDT